MLTCNQHPHSFKKETQNLPSIYHKTWNPWFVVNGEMAGRAHGEAVLDMMSTLKTTAFDKGIRIKWNGEGEWKMLFVLSPALLYWSVCFSDGWSRPTGIFLPLLSV